MSGTVTINRLDTGVPGLNAVLGGGLPEFSFNLIAGPPGCGKTTLAHQLMFALATAERTALYFTVLGEPPLKMLRYQQQFDFFKVGRLESTIRFITLTEEALDGDLERVQKRITSEVQRTGPGLVFVDSFRSVSLANGNDSGSTNRLQAFVQQLGVQMTSWQATTFLIGEYFSENDPNPVFTVADGIFWLRQSVERNSMVRKLEIMKMRGQSTQPGLHTFRISSAGLKVFPSAVTVTVAERTPEPETNRTRLSLGVAALDDMLGGGLPRGYSLLVAGPSGSGKSVLAASFVSDGIDNGETAVIALFEQRPMRVRNPLISSLIETGRVGVVDSFAPDLSIDEVLQLLLTEIRRLSATRVVIDSLSGFELSLAPTFRADFRESLARLVLSLGMEGVTVLLTSELEDRYTDLRFSPHGTAFLTDAIIVQRYIELDSRLRRMLAVVKVRGSSHSDELREYSIDDGGIQVGARLDGYEGLLGGRPRTLTSAGDSSTSAA